MTWSFETEPEFQQQLDWVQDFCRTEVEPLDHVIGNAFDLTDPVRQRLIPPLQNAVRDRGLWACHLTPELGGQGFGQLKLALLNEIIGRSQCGPVVFGCQAPDSGNAEVLAKYGTPELKERYLKPLIRNDIVSAFSMTEPQGGSDPTQFVTRATYEDGQWVLEGEKWFTSNARFASFFLTLAVTDPDAPPHGRMSMFVVPTSTPGVEIIRNLSIAGRGADHATHAYVQYHQARVPADHLLGERGMGFAVAQTRLGGGRIHHAMRTVGLAQLALEMSRERAQSRITRGGRLGNKQLVQEMLADSWIELQQFRLLVLQTAWKIDKYHDYERVRADISAVKAIMPKVLHDIAARALQIHGSLGVSNEMPFGDMVLEAFHRGLADGPTEVHKLVIARQLLSDDSVAPDLFPSRHLPRLRAAALDKYRQVLTDPVPDAS